MNTGRAAKPTVQLVLSAVIGAILLAGQVALRLIPNVEVVTVIIIVAAFAFPPSVSICAALVFCTGEWLLYGYGYWVPAYYIYWCLLAAISTLLKRLRQPDTRVIAAALIAAVCTAFFGVLTSAVEALIIMGVSEKFWGYFAVVYLRGIWFYAVHAGSNTVIVALLFRPLAHAAKNYWVSASGGDA